MSGGDLDGDVYMVIFEERIVNQLSDNSIHAPAKYEKFVPKGEGLPKDSEISAHIAYYFSLDNLGSLSNMHLALCDYIGKNGPLDPKAQQLSRLIAVAVDFAKHGECVTEEDYKDIKVDRYPDFMEKDPKLYKTYKSETILGQLYRNVECEQYYQKCIHKEHGFSICLNYHINRLIISRK